jgi:hypothetical protein
MRREYASSVTITRQVITSSKTLRLKEVANASRLSILLVALVVYGVTEVVRYGRIAQAMRLTIRLGRHDVGTVVGRGSIHGRLERSAGFGSLSAGDCAR